MSYTIPNQDLAAFPVQSQIFEIDLAIIAAGYAGYRVVSGCAVTAQGTPDMTVAVAAGRIRPGDETLVDVTAEASLAIDAADATLWRLDLVSSAIDGTATHTAGTAASLTAVKPPDLPAGHVALAFVTVPPGATSIDSTQIVDKRLFMAGPEPVDPVDHGSIGAAETFDYADGSDHKGTLDAAPTITLAGPSSVIAQYLFLHLTEDGSGGHINSATWDDSIVWEGGTVPTFDDSPGAEIGVAFWSDDGAMIWHGFTKFGAVGATGPAGADGTSGDADALTTAETDTGKRLAPDGAGGVAWAAGGGGGGTVSGQVGGAAIYIPGLQGSPDIRVAGANDDEFDTTASGLPTGWTQLGTPDAQNANTLALSHYYVKANAGTGANLKGIYKAAPSMPFTVTCKLTASSQVPYPWDNGNGNYAKFAILAVAEATPGKLEAISACWNNAQGSRTLEVLNWTNPTTFNNQPSGDAACVQAVPIYLRLVVASSTSVTYAFSFDGLLWTTLLSAHDPGFTIGSVALAVSSEQANFAVEALYDWIRFA
jgi:hypothetical protein